MNIFTHFTNIDHILNDEEFNQSLDMTLNKFEKRQPYCDTQNGGRAITTCSDNHVLLNLNKNFLIKDWFENTLTEFLKTKKVKMFNYRLHRSWCNRIFHGCFGRPHNHTRLQNGIVMVLYYQIPENSSKYVLIHENVEKPSIEDYDPDKLSFIDVKSGLGVCHSTEYYHAVTEHMSDKPRTVFVFDIDYEVLEYDTTR